MNRISSSLATLKEHYEVVVVGSGYGGGVAASRMARAGRKVCLLERGKEMLPGEYPNSLTSAKKEIQIDAPYARFGDKTGMLDFRTNKDMNVLVGCGLGGTSLINANVALESDPRIFATEAWPEPEAGKSWPDVLAPYYGIARTMLDSTSYPADYPPLNKLAALEQSAKGMGQPFYRPPINVNFKDRINPFGVTQRACNNCGDCCSGCNVSAKNTTLMNYLPDAHNHGAEVFTLASVRYVQKDPQGWRVMIADLSTDPEGTKEVTCDILILSAGTLGSTEILLRSQAKGLALSSMLGNRFSGNGDVFAIGYDSYWQETKDDQGNVTSPNINGIGVGSNSVPSAQYPGPCITGIIDLRKTAEQVGDGLVIEEGSIPGALASILAPTFLFGMTQYGNFFEYGTDDGKARLMSAQQLSNAISDPNSSLTSFAYQGPVARTQTYLVMSHDDAGGKMLLEDDRLRIYWKGIGKSRRIERDNDKIREANQYIKGQFLPNPIWTEPLGNQVISVHPLGGCRMGQDATTGVTDAKCRVFANDPKDPTAVHEGLYVMDGSVFPGSAGVNPLLTITAISERAVRLLAADRGWTIDYSLNGQDPWSVPNPELPGTGAAPAAGPSLYDRASQPIGVLTKVGEALQSVVHKVVDGVENLGEEELLRLANEAIAKYPTELSSSLSFSETMAGYFTTNFRVNPNPPAEQISNEFEIAYAQGKTEKNLLQVDLLIEIDNIAGMIADPQHAAKVSGLITCPQLFAQPLKAQGVFKLFAKDPDTVDTWNMVYDMETAPATPGAPVYHFHGRKIVPHAGESDWFRDTTTLYTNLFRREGRGEKLVGKGILKLTISDLLNQAKTISAQPNKGGIVSSLPNLVDRALNAIFLQKFAGFFGKILFRAYGGMLTDLANFTAADQAVRPHRALKAPAPQTYTVTTADGFNLKLTRYQGGRKGPLILAPGFTVNASSFATDTVDQNLVEYLCNLSPGGTASADNYDVWLFDYRASPDAGNKGKSFDLDDIALQDWPAAVDFVRKTTGAPDVQVLAHCAASLTFLMAKLRGLTGVRSAICSQLTVHPVNNWMNYLKADIDIVQVLGQLAHTTTIDIRSSSSTTDKAMDAVLWDVPVPAGEACTSPCCRRVFAVYGPAYTHAQLNDLTHTAISEWFGEVETSSFTQLTNIMRLGYAVDRNGKNTYLPEVNKIDIPITFAAADRNLQFLPESSLRTLNWLRANRPPEWFDRYVFKGYAHMDLFIGKNAAKDVFPEFLRMLRELDRKAAAINAPPAAAGQPK